MYVSAIVCTYNRCALLKRLFAHLHSQFDKFNGEIIFIDNCSTDDTAIILNEIVTTESEIEVRYIYEAKQGLSHARNRGIAEARGDIILFIDDDALPMPGWLNEHCRIYLEDAHVGSVGGKIELLLEEGATKPWWLSRLFNKTLGEYDLPVESCMDYGRGWDLPAGGNMSFNRSVLEDVGLFDPILGRVGDVLLAGEEYELGWRVIRSGWRSVYNPKALVKHIIPSSRLCIGYFRDRFRTNRLTSRLLAEKGLGTVHMATQLKIIFASILVDLWRIVCCLSFRDIAYYILNIEANAKESFYLISMMVQKQSINDSNTTK